jgi:hypothetical protein
MRKFNSQTALALILGAIILFSCESENGHENGFIDRQSTFVISATVGNFNYLLTTDQLTEGTLTTIGAGKETDLGNFWIYHQNRYLFRLVYNQGGAGISSSYYLNNRGRIAERDGIFEIRRFTTFGTHGNHLITASTGALGSELAETVSGENHIPRGFQFNMINMDTETISTNTEAIRADNFLGNGEYVTLAGILDVGGRIFTAPIPMGMSHYGVVMFPEHLKYPDLVTTTAGGSGSGAFTPGQLQWTQHPNEAWIAIFNDRTFRNPTLIRTDKISYAAGRFRSQYFQMIWAADNGDVYVFSPSFAKTMTDPRQRTTLPAGVVRIRAGASDFDPDYYVNLEELSGGVGFLNSWHISGDKFLLLMYDSPFVPGFSTVDVVANRLAIFRGEARTLTFVDGLPTPETITSFARTPHFAEGRVYLPIMVHGQDPAIYVIDSTTATAARGISVRADAITSVGRLD